MFWILLNLIIFLFGLIIGSFLNCLIYRLETGGSFLRGRSYCPHCKHILGWQDLIPVLSFLILKGKCRYCSRKISWQYPLVEFSTAILFLLPLIYGNRISINLFFYWIFTCFLIIIFVYDLKYYIIPDKVIYPAIATTFLYQIITNFRFQITNFYSPILSAFGAALFFLITVLISRGKWMGLGDIKLAFLMGLVLGWPNILAALFLTFFIGAIIGLGLIVAGKKRLSSEIPFAPFLVSGTFIALFFGQQLINWYLNLFLIQ